MDMNIAIAGNLELGMPSKPQSTQKAPSTNPK